MIEQEGSISNIKEEKAQSPDPKRPYNSSER